MNTPVPVASEVFGLLVVGFAVVAQQVPLAVIAPPPSAVIFPPDTAVVKPIEVAVVVVSVGNTTGLVVKVSSFPYAVPALFVAYERIWYVVPGIRPVTLLTKFPLPVPSLVVKLLIVGVAVVAQQTPLAVTAPPPLAVIFPPETAVVNPIEVTAVVVKVGITT
jgi:hypothetical protein